MQRQRRPLIFSALAALGLSSLASVAAAQPQPFSDDPPRYRSNRPYPSEVERAERARAEAEGRTDSPFTFAGGVDFRDQYFFRGYNQVSSGLAAQPYASLGYTIFKNDDVAITPHAGFWLDLTENKAPEPPDHFREVRTFVGLGVDVGRFLFDFQWVFYNSPGDAFEDVHEIGVDLRYDDRDHWREKPLAGSFVALQPSFSLFYQASDDNDDDQNTYVGVGLEPTLKAFDVARLPVTVSFPLTLGGSYDGYYKDDDGHNSNFGFWEAGVRCALPLARSGYGARWSVDAEVDFVRLVADSAEKANGNDGDDIVFRFGLSFR